MLKILVVIVVAVVLCVLALASFVRGDFED